MAPASATSDHTPLRALTTALLLGGAVACGGASAAGPDAGRALFQSVAKGNCLACHRTPSDPSAETRATVGPPLSGMAARFPDRARLRAQIWDAAVANPDTSMPPYGRNGILSEPEIDKIVDYIHAL